jgi:M6 family metalloprotease-like protein
MIPHTEDITLITGEEVVSPPTSWLSKSSIFNIENVVAVNASEDVIHFSRSDMDNHWQAVNVSSQTDIKIRGSLTNWQKPFGSREFLAGVSPPADLIVFESLSHGFWHADNVSKDTGEQVSSFPTSWVNSNVSSAIWPENIAALNSSATELLVFSREGVRDWEVVNLTAKTGKTVIGDATSWISHHGLTSVEHIAGTSPDGSLVVFWKTSNQDWQAINVSAIAGGGSITGSRPVSWIDFQTEYVAVCGQNQRLLVYEWRGGLNWFLLDVTAITGVKIAEVYTVYQLDDEGMETILSARGIDGSLLQFWYNRRIGHHHWQVFNYSQATGASWASRSTAWLTRTVGDQPIEHIAAITLQRHLLMAWDYGWIRILTDRLSRPFQLMKRQHTPRKIVVILWDPHRSTDPAPSVPAVVNLLFGQTNSVRDYFLENSGGRFTIDPEGVFGWFPASRPPGYWWGPPDTTDSDGDGWVNPHVQKWAEAIRQADPQFNYSVYDKNPFDGELRPDELGVLIVIPQNTPFGTNRHALGREFPNPQPLVVDGVTIGTIAEAYIGNPPNLGIVAHELTHLFLHHGDMYWTFHNPYAAGHYSLMDGTTLGTHIDPFAKLKFGWLRPQLIVRSGHYSLPSIETERFVWILMNPAHSIDEYYIVENRWRGTSYDKSMPDVGGLAIWHIMEDPAVFGSVPPPPKVTPEQWEQVSRSDGVRRAIRFLRPLIGETSIDDRIALRDGADTITGFDVLSNDPNLQHSSLKWADGTPSGFSIKNISPAGQVMTADIHVPW